MSWLHIEFAWSWLEDESRLRLVGARKDFWLQGGLVFGTIEALYLLEILQQ